MCSILRPFILPVLALRLIVGALSPALATVPEAPPRWQGFVQPLLITLDRHHDHVIVALEDHPSYESLEAMVTWRAGRPPLIRAVLIQHDGFQIDHFNDPELAADRAAIFTGRQTVYRPIDFVAVDVAGIPVVWLRFTSYRGEDITLYFEGLAPPSPELGGFIDPGSHAQGASLPIMWAGASSLSSDASVVTLDDIPFALGGPPPFSSGGIYTADFRIGVFRAGHLDLAPISAPALLEVGQKWLYQDHLGNLHTYEIVAAAGSELTIRKTTTSPALTEEIIQVEVVGDRLELRSVRATGRRSGEGPIPPAPGGLTLDLSADGSFSVSLDEHAELVTGTVSRTEDAGTTRWILQPVEPPWATSRKVTATLTRQAGSYSLDNEIGEP